MQVWTLPLLLWGCTAFSAGQQAAPAKRLVCYYTNWSRYRGPLSSFTPKNINPYLCTHLHYARANTNREQMTVGPAEPDSDFVKKGYEQIVALKKVNPDLKVLLMLGGSAGSEQMAFKEIIKDTTKMKRLVRNAITYVRSHNFDGIELDWKVAGQRTEYANLLEIMAAAFQQESEETGRERLVLSTTTPANTTMLMRDFDVTRITRSVDYINALVYQFHSGVQDVTGHHAPLFTSDPDELEYADFTVQMYVNLGGDPSKLNIAVPTFGKTFTLSDPDDRGLGAPVTGAGIAGELSKSKGALSFAEICERVSVDGWVANRPFPDSVGPYASKGDQWVAYDDEFMMRRKGAYVREKGLGGAAVWTLAHDDFRGFCTGQHFPLIEALKMGMYEEGPVTTTTPRPPVTPEYDNTAIFRCPADGRFPKPDNCKVFYACTNNVAQETTCKDGLVFDAEENFCSETAACVVNEPPRLTVFQPTPPPATPVRLTPPAPTSPAALSEPVEPSTERQETMSSSNAAFRSTSLAPLPLITIVPPPPPNSADPVATEAETPPPATRVRVRPTPAAQLSAPPRATSETVVPNTEPQGFTRLVPLPLKTMVPLSPLSFADTVVTATASPATSKPEMKLDMDMEVKSEGQLERVLRLIEELGGIESVRRLLEVVGKPQEVATTTQQPRVAQVVTTREGKTKVKVHVTVEVEPF